MMRSTLSSENFRKRLTELTSVGEPTINGTPLAIINIFSPSKYLFYGQFDKDRFRLTSNGIANITPYVLDGTFKQVDEVTEVNYEIKKIWFGYLWVRLVPVVVIFVFNYFFIHDMGLFGMSLTILFNLIAIVLFLPIVITIYQKKRLERLFKKHMELN